MKMWKKTTRKMKDGDEDDEFGRKVIKELPKDTGKKKKESV